MLKINLVSSIATIETSEEINPILIDKEGEIFNHNRTQVLNSFATIETYMAHLIRNEFLGNYDPNEMIKFENFFTKIIHTNWFNFNEKRKLTVEIITVNKSKQEVESIDKAFRKIMSTRNALTHGQLYTDGLRSELRYYESEFKIDKLDSKYWQNVKTNFETCFSILNTHLKEKGILK